MNLQNDQQPQPFAFNFSDPYNTFKDGKPVAIPYVIDGWLTQGGLSVLGGKSKQGKSSLARYEAVCVAKGLPFLGRDTVQGEVIIINLEDPMNHVDNCLHVLGYDEQTDSRIRIVDTVAPTLAENVQALDDALTKFPNVRLVILDTLAKFILVDDLNDYMPVLRATQRLQHLARKFPHVHIQGLAHCKKVVTSDPFDSFLGSTALRGATDTNFALYEENRQRVIATETRVGRSISPTIIQAVKVTSAGADVVKDFSLDKPFDEWKQNQSQQTERKEKVSHEARIIAYLQETATGTATQADILDEVEGKRTSKIAAIETLKQMNVVTVTGVKQSPTNPLTLHLNKEAVKMHDFINKHKGKVK